MSFPKFPNTVGVKFAKSTQFDGWGHCINDMKSIFRITLHTLQIFLFIVWLMSLLFWHCDRWIFCCKKAHFVFFQPCLTQSLKHPRWQTSQWLVFCGLDSPPLPRHLQWETVGVKKQSSSEKGSAFTFCLFLDQRFFFFFFNTHHSHGDLRTGTESHLQWHKDRERGDSISPETRREMVTEIKHTKYR